MHLLFVVTVYSTINVRVNNYCVALFLARKKRPFGRFCFVISYLTFSTCHAICSIAPLKPPCKWFSWAYCKIRSFVSSVIVMFTRFFAMLSASFLCVYYTHYIHTCKAIISTTYRPSFCPALYHEYNRLFFLPDVLISIFELYLFLAFCHFHLSSLDYLYL